MRSLNNTRRLAPLAIALLLGIAFSVHAGTSVVASGEFSGKSDHVTTGGVSILETGAGYVVVLESNFSLDGAPDPKLGFGKNGTFDAKTLFSPLKDKTGLQVYELPKTIDPKKFDEIYVWCEKFDVPLGVAKLH